MTAGFAPLAADDPGAVGGYELRARLGAGGMGRVYLSFSSGGRALAIKVMRPEYAEDEEFRRRFQQEIAAAQRVQSLYTAPVVDSDARGRPPWLATAYIPGPSLQRAVADGGPLPLPTVFRLLAGVAEGLAAVHACGLVHRDLKPANVLLADDGPRVIDFGIARAADATTLTRTGMRIGTPQFMAPEQILGRTATPAVDVFALGNLAVFAATGRTAFGDGDERALFYRIENKPPDLDGCPPELRAIAERCLAKEPGRRPSLTEIVEYARGQTMYYAGSWLPAAMAASLTAYDTAAFRPTPPAPPTPVLPARTRHRPNLTKKGRTAIAVLATVAMITAIAALVRPGSSGSPAGPETPVTIVVDTFGDSPKFGYKEPIERWNASHTNIKIQENEEADPLGQYWAKMTQWLQSGSGAGDVVGIEESGMGLAAAHPEWWTDLSRYGLNSRRSDYPAYMWQGGMASDGKLFSLGADIGGVSICYRTDLFKKAALPTDRNQVAELWPTWDDFIKVGRRFQTKVTGTHWVDGGNTFYDVVLGQEAAKNGGVSYFDRSNKLIVASNPAVRSAFDFAVTLSQGGLSAKLPNLTPQWATGTQNGAFATLACPSWMLGEVSANAGDGGKGKWDIAPVPGVSGNLGGSWLAVPAQSKHPKEAAMVADYLTSAKVETEIFKLHGHLPSNLKAQQDPTVQNAVSGYFNNAPIGQIFTRSAGATASLRPVFPGVEHAQVKDAIESVIAGIDNGSVPYDEAWNKLVNDAEKANTS
jgi:cellobiose transport system substrate-binding protein